MQTISFPRSIHSAFLSLTHSSVHIMIFIQSYPSNPQPTHGIHLEHILPKNGLFAHKLPIVGVMTLQPMLGPFGITDDAIDVHGNPTGFGFVMIGAPSPTQEPPISVVIPVTCP